MPRTPKVNKGESREEDICTMRLLAISDRVERSLQGPDLEGIASGVEAVVSCGDLPFDYLEYLVTFLDVPLYYVRGNHDPTESSGKSPRGCIPIDGRVEDLGGVSIAGFSGCMWYSGGPNQCTERQMFRKSLFTSFRLRFGNLLGRRLPIVFVSHASPRGLGDAPDPCHRGFKVFGDLVSRHTPKLWIHGHVHLYGRHRNDDSYDLTVGETTVVNAYGYRIVDIST